MFKLLIQKFCEIFRNTCLTTQNISNWLLLTCRINYTVTHKNYETLHFLKINLTVYMTPETMVGGPTNLNPASHGMGLKMHSILTTQPKSFLQYPDIEPAPIHTHTDAWCRKISTQKLLNPRRNKQWMLSNLCQYPLLWGPNPVPIWFPDEKLQLLSLLVPH